MESTRWQRVKKRLPRLAAEVLVFLAVVWAVEAWMTRNAVRGPAPPITGVTVAGESVAWPPTSGEPSLIYFWATWCPVCHAQQGTIDGLSRDHPVLTVAMQSGDDAAVSRFLEQEQLAFPAVNDPDGQLSRRYGVIGVPAGFVLDGNGDVRFVTRGYTTGLGLRLRLLLANWL